MLAAVCVACEDAPLDNGATAIAALHSAASGPVVDGTDGHVFLTSELHFLGAGPFWGEQAASVSRAQKPEWADPEAAIVDFYTQLKQKGIELLVVPVPAKATVAAAHLPIQSTTNNDGALQTFLQRLRSHGIDVLDLKPSLLRVQAGKDTQAYLSSDTHWSPQGLSAAADDITAWLTSKELTPKPLPTLKQTEQALDIRGDLIQLRDGSDGPSSETINLLTPITNGPTIARDAPVLLLGDSHALIFSAGGDMYAEGAGLGEHLAGRLGSPVDRIAVRGSGSTASRISLLRRRDQLKGKQAVIWVFAARDLTESDGWRKVPVIETSGP